MIPSASRSPAQDIESDRGISTASQHKAESPNWASAEQEKLRLYNDARSRTVAAQSATGIRLDTIGLDDSAPPEYAPPLPTQPKEEYSAPSRPVSMYTSKASPPDTSPVGSPKGGPLLSTYTDPMLSGYMSAAEEKEQQKRRFEQAQSRVVSGSSNGLSTPSSPARECIEMSPTTSPSQAPSQAYMSAAEEKEQQRRRFEQAQERVVSANRRAAPEERNSTATNPKAVLSSISTGNPAPFEEPIPYDAIFPSTSSSPAAQMNGSFSEKEQMRRYYEAQDKVEQARSQAGPSSTSTGAPPPIASESSLISSSSTAPVNEKEQMSRYYEALDRVNRASASASGGDETADAPTNHTGSASEASPSAYVDSSTGAGFVSAAEEKAAFQMRFADMHSAVDRNFTATSPAQFTASSTDHQPMMSSLSSLGTSPPSSPILRDPTIKAGKAKAIGPMSPTLSISESLAGVNAPPPPLPARPPIDYINLLSPVQESSSPWGRMSRDVIGNGENGIPDKAL